MDIGLPGMNGLEVCRAFRADPLFSQTTIIAQSGWGQDTDRAASASAGFNNHLVKPVGIDELESVLAKIGAGLQR